MMKLGLVHARDRKPPESGVTRYGRILAREASQRSDLQVQEQDLLLSGDQKRDLQAVRECGRALEGVDLFHVQFSRYLWGTGRVGADLLRELRGRVESPMVITFHDVQPEIYPDQSAFALFQAWFREVRKSGGGLLWSLWRAFRLVQSGQLKDRSTLHWIARHAASVIVCTAEEKQRLLPFFDGRPVTVIPHFVEKRELRTSPAAAKRKLGLEPFKVVILSGFIFPHKGHEVALEALRRLSAEYFLVFAGGPSVGGENYVNTLQKQARELGLEGRLRITGSLSETELENYLLAADVAICPFMQMSASGSLSTWLSVGTVPIIASDLPQIQSYNAMVSGAIEVFQTGDGRSLADMISKSRPDASREARLKLRELLSVERIVEEHARLYQSLLTNVSCTV